MLFYSHELDMNNPKDREIAHNNKLEAQRERRKLIKERNKSYLKGQRGRRLYFDYDKKFDYENVDDVDEYENDLTDPRRQVKCVFTKDLRREKLLQYFIYLNGRRVLVRDLAWKFAVTERTIQNDLHYLIENDFITRVENKTKKGNPTRNSFIVNKEKLKELHLSDSFTILIFVAKKDKEWYVLSQTNYLNTIIPKRFKTSIEDFDFELPNFKERFPNRIDKHSLKLAKEIFGIDLQNFYKGLVFTHISKGHFEDEYKKGKIKNEYWKDKNYFTLFIFDECINPASDDYMWIKLSIAPRRFKNFTFNKGINYISKNILGVK